jgi:hypothetical protein
MAKGGENVLKRLMDHSGWPGALGATLVLLCLGGASPAEPPPASATPIVMEAQHQVNWGYGCGGHCAFNWAGSSSVRIELNPGGATQIVDAGEETRYSNYPEFSDTNKRTWRFVFAGAWRETDGVRKLEMKLRDSSCQIEDEVYHHAVANAAPNASASSKQQDEKKTVPCPAISRGLTLNCARATVSAYDKSLPARVGAYERPEASAKVKKVEASAWRCVLAKFDGDTNYLGTDSDWVFGEKEPIDTWKSGEPHPKDDYFLRRDLGSTKK